MNPWRATIWTASFALIGAIAYAAAITSTLMIERRLQPVPAPEAAVRAQPAAPRPQMREQRPLTAYQEVLDRNIFGAKRTVAKPVARKASPRAPVHHEAPFQAQLTGTFLSGDDSFAMVIGRGEREERVYRVGECVPQIGDAPRHKCASGQARLAKIELNRIVVVKNGKRFTVDISKGPPEPNRRVAARSALDRNRTNRQRLSLNRPPVERRVIPAKPPRADEEDQGDETANGEPFPAEREGNTYQVTVPNAEVDKAFENFSEIVAQAAAVPIIENGQPQGFQLRKIRPGSIFQRLGLKNYDLIKGVNGQSITTADQALRLFTLFRNEREITLDVKRRNEELRFNYTIE